MSKIAVSEIASCPGCGEDQSALDFSMAFQPIVDMSTGGVFAYEALVRGTDGAGAETVLARVDDRNRYRFDQMCRQRAIELACRFGLLDTDARLAINFMPNAILSPMSCIQSTLRAAAAHGMPLERLILEFTEDEQVQDLDHLEAIVDTYRRLGLATAIDDIGAGHSGLGLLSRFSPDLAKISMDLVHDIDREERRHAIVGHIMSLGRTLGFRVIAEGVERQGEMDTLRGLGVELMQGFLFARPAFEALPEARIPA